MTTASAGECTNGNSLTNSVFRSVTPYNGRELTSVMEDLLPLFSSWFCCNSVHCTRVTDITSPNTAVSLYTTVRTSYLPVVQSSAHSHKSRAVDFACWSRNSKMQFSNWYSFLNWCEDNDSSLARYDMVLIDNYQYSEDLSAYHFRILKTGMVVIGSSTAPAIILCSLL